MTLRSAWRLAPCWLLLALLGACQPKIGDDCRLSTECGIGSVSRVCDTTQPGGYCTIYNCEPGLCPSEAICVGFYMIPSAAPGCAIAQGSTRLARSFCLRRCESDSDCRSDYVCADMNRLDAPWRSAVLEGEGTDGRACVPPYSGPPVNAEVDTGVCEGTVVPPPDAGNETGGGGSGAGGQAGGGEAGESTAGAAGQAGLGQAGEGAAGSFGQSGAGGQGGSAGVSAGGLSAAGQSSEGGAAATDGTSGTTSAGS